MSFSPFVLDAQRLAWSGLAALGGLFVSLSLRLREDREFALLGSGITLMCLVVAPDIWTNPAAEGLPEPWIEALQDAQQIAACAYVWVALRFAQALIGKPGRRALRIHTAALAAFGLGFYLDALSPSRLFIAVSGGKYSANAAYVGLFAPYLSGLFVWIVGLTIAGWRRAHGEARRTLGAVSIAYVLLAIGGILDFAAMSRPGFLFLPSVSVLGALSMGAIGIYLFTAKLIRLYESQRETLLKIAELQGDLEIHRPLGELGRSAAHITESIRGYVAELKADADSLRRRPETAARAEVARIEGARRRLEGFTGGILEFSRSARLGERRLMPPSALAAECMAVLAPSDRARVRVTGLARQAVAVDPALARRALAELVRNAFAAGAGRVEIRLREGFGRLSLAFEDDGPGFPADRLDRICEPFFTTRKSEGACGLGAATAQGILRAHGGSLAYYPSPSGTGLLANAVLPQAGPATRWDPAGPGWILICDEAGRIARFLEVCGHVGIVPVVRASRDAGQGYGFSGPGFALVDAALGPVASLPARWKRFRLAGDPALPSGQADLLREETLVSLSA